MIPRIPFVRYVIVGLVTNGAGYLVYLGLTWAGMGPKSAMTLLYLAGALSSFFANRRWTFDHDGRLGASLARYAASHVFCYLLNLVILLVFVDWAGWPHQLVQAGAVITLAFTLFLLNRYFVFRRPAAAVDRYADTPIRETAP